MGLNMEIYIERRKFIQEHETVSIDEYNKICDSLLSLNYTSILKEYESVIELVKN